MIESLITRQAVIFFGVAAAILVTLGSFLRFQYRREKRKLTTAIIYIGYFLFILSLSIFIYLGFKSPS